MSNDALLDRIAGPDPIAALLAMEEYAPHVRAEDLPRLVSAYGAHRAWDLRVDVVDLIGRIGSAEAYGFLREIAKSRTHYLVRYYAMRNLIDNECGEWRPASGRKLKSDFYASLIAYERFRRGEIDRAELRALALPRTTWPGDHWAWLAQPDEESAGARNGEIGNGEIGTPGSPEDALT